MARRHLGQDDSPPATPGITIDSPRTYELMAGVGFFGQRRRLFTRLVELSGARPGDHVLDVGCGTGYFTRMAAKAVTPGGTVVGIDPSPPVVHYARRRRAADTARSRSASPKLLMPLTSRSTW